MSAEPRTFLELLARRVADKLLEAWLAEDSPARGDPAPPPRRASRPRPVPDLAERIARSRCPFCSKSYRGLAGLQIHIAAMVRAGRGHVPAEK